MPLPTINPTKTAAWSKLKKHYKETQGQRLQDLFEGDAKRGEQLRICWDDFYVDFSKKRFGLQRAARQDPKLNKMRSQGLTPSFSFSFS